MDSDKFRYLNLYNGTVDLKNNEIFNSTNDQQKFKRMIKRSIKNDDRIRPSSSSRMNHIYIQTHDRLTA